MKKHTILVAFVVIQMIAAGAHAQVSSRGFALDRFDPADRGSDWFSLESSSFTGHLKPAAGLLLDYANDPLVLLGADDSEVSSVVQDQLFLHLGGSLVLWQDLRVGLSLPLALVSSGDDGQLAGTTFGGADGAALGDIRLSGDYRFFGHAQGTLRLAGGLRLHVPTGSPSSFTGDGSVRVVPQLHAAGDYGRLAYSGRVGLQFRARGGDFAGERFGTELQLGAAVGYRFFDRKLLVGPELNGAVSLASGGQDLGSTTPFEVLLGAHYDFAPDWRAGLGVGPGLSDGFGSPDYRVVASIEWVPQTTNDRDRDGIPDNVDACPSLAGIASTDPSQHGCPADSDGDGILDEADACPEVAGEPSEEPQLNGCPADDDDGDGIENTNDACPSEAGKPSDDLAKNGCPLAKIEQDQIVIIDQVQFATNSSEILPSSDGVLNEVRAILGEHSELTLVSIEGHTDSTGGRPHNLELSRRRAAAVASWLVKAGVKKERLRSSGFGPDKPIADNGDSDGRQKNRRVEFHIIEVNGESIK